MAQLALEDVQQAVLKAHKNGDTDGAKRLVAIYKRQSQMGPGPTAVQPEPQRDSAIGYSVDQAQRMFGKGAEAIGRATGIQGVEDFGTRTVAQQDKDIQQGGYQPEYTGSLRDNFNQGGFSQAGGWLKEKSQENLASGGFMLAGGAATAATAAVSVPAAYLIGAATMGGGLALGTGEAAFEQEEKLGDYDAVLSVGAGSIIALLDRFGAGKVIPKSKLLKMTTGEITEELNKKGFIRAASAFSRRALTEGGTEALQEGVSVAGASSRGAEYTQKELIDRGIDAAALGTTYGAGVQTVTGPVSAIAGSSEPVTKESASFAQRLETIAKENGFNLKDIKKTSTSGARATVDLAHVQMTTRLKFLFNELKEQVTPNKKDSLEQFQEKIMLAAGKREAGSKTKTVVGQQEIDAAMSLGIDKYGEGQEILNLFGELNEMTKLHNSGYQGGLSLITDQLSPLGTGAGYDRGAVASEKILRPLASGSLAVSTGGASLAGQVAAVGIGRGVDALTGRRSTVRRYIKKNKKGSSFDRIPQSSYLHEDERQKNLAEKKEADEALERTERLRQEGARLDLPPMPDSPQGMLEQALDMNLASIIPVINDLHNDPNTSPDVRRSARSALNSVANGGRIDDLTDLIRHLKKRINPDNTFWRNKEKEINVVEGRPPEQSRRDAAIQQGIDDNRALINKLKADIDVANISPKLHKIKLIAALDMAVLDLGTNPVVRLDNIRRTLSTDGVPDALIDEFFNPYLERVTTQQANRPTVDREINFNQTIVPPQEDVKKNEVADDQPLDERVFNETSLEMRKEDGFFNNETKTVLKARTQNKPLTEVVNVIKKRSRNKSYKIIAEKTKKQLETLEKNNVNYTFDYITSHRLNFGSTKQGITDKSFRLIDDEYGEAKTPTEALRKKNARSAFFEFQKNARGVAFTNPMIQRGQWNKSGVGYEYLPYQMDVNVFINDVVEDGGVREETILHEAIHAATVPLFMIAQKVKSQGRHSEGDSLIPDLMKTHDDFLSIQKTLENHVNELGQEMTQVYKKGKQEFGKNLDYVGYVKSKGYTDQQIIGYRHPAVSNVRELITYGLTNRDFQKYLETIPMEGSKNKTLWDQFVQTIRKLLGLSASNDTVLSELLRVSNEMLELDKIEISNAMELLKQPTYQ